MFQMPTASLSATVISGGPCQQLRIVALNLYSAALSDASTKLSHFFFNEIDTHRLCFLMHWAEFLPQHEKADQP